MSGGIGVAGVLLVFSFLIIPAAIGMLYTSGARRLVVAWGVGVAASLAGLATSYAWDLPTGSTMVCAFGAALAAAGLVKPLLERNARRRALRAARATAAVVLAGSAIWLVAAPRADQPLLDALEYAVPGVRALYLTRGESQIYRDADDYAQRYRRDAERLNEKESKSRWEGAALSDMDVARISSFLQAYNEMRKGEEFVTREVRARARERSRWSASALLLILALAIFPWGARPSRARVPSAG